MWRNYHDEQVDILRETIEHITADTPGRGDRIHLFFDMLSVKNSTVGVILPASN